MIAKEKTGILVTEYDLEAMAEGMVRFGKNVELRRQMGKAAANALRKNETVMDNLRLISELIDRHKLKR
jgi:glycosyltransferase involved in cell wall biosynthesis